MKTVFQYAVSSITFSYHTVTTIGSSISERATSCWKRIWGKSATAAPQPTQYPWRHRIFKASILLSHIGFALHLLKPSAHKDFIALAFLGWGFSSFYALQYLKNWESEVNQVKEQKSIIKDYHKQTSEAEINRNLTEANTKIEKQNIEIENLNARLEYQDKELEENRKIIFKLNHELKTAELFKKNTETLNEALVKENEELNQKLKKFDPDYKG